MPGSFARGTLGRQLLVRVVLIVAAIAVLLSGASLVATQQFLVRNIDSQLPDVVRRLHGPDGAPDFRNLAQAGQPQGTLAAIFLGGRSQAGVLSSQKGKPGLTLASITKTNLSALSDIPADGNYSTVRLTGLGQYRIVALPAQLEQENPDGSVTRTSGKVIVGLSLANVNEVLGRIVQIAVPLSLLAIIGAAFAVGAVVRRSLRPLNRVAATAQQVSQLQLDRGEVALGLRVPPPDADPVSEVGRVGQAFNHMLDNVAGALAARQTSETKLKQFIADASHELRNPLASIRGYAELTRRDRDQLPSDTAYALGRVEAEAERMSSLVEDLLLLARLDSGPAIEVRPVDVTELLINAISDARAAGPDHHWSLDLGHLGDGDPAAIVIGDRNRLHQAVVNLLANARTHTPPGTAVSAGLRIEAGDHGAAVVITVADNGPGIPTDIQDKVFERFTRGDDSRARSGDLTVGSTGLGLAIVAAVAEAHHGMVRVRSVAGDTRFELRLPLAGNSIHSN